MSQINQKTSGIKNKITLGRWRDLRLRAKIILALLAIEILSISALTFFALTRSSKIITSISDRYENSVETQTDTQLTNLINAEASNADQVFSLTQHNLIKLADYRAQLASQGPVLSQGAYWDARQEVVLLPGGQYTNSRNDPGTVLIPSNVQVNDAVFDDINVSAYLDFAAPKILEDQPEAVAVYYLGALGYSIYYPNLDLASFVPADYDVRKEPLYTIVTPQNDPDRSVRWTEPYQDQAGTGLIVTASAPVYDEKGVFQGVMSIDLQLGRIAQNISQIKVGDTGFAFLVDDTGHILVMPPEGYPLFGLQPEEVPLGETPTQTVLGRGSEELQALTNQMTAGESGLSIVTINGVESYMAFTPLQTAGYSLGIIAPVSELNTAIASSRQEIQNEIKASLWIAAFIFLGLLIVAAALSFITGQLIAAPLARLTQTVEQVSSGDLSARAKVESKDETGSLAAAFNYMSAQLSESFATLEQRVADRTRNLELAAEVGRAVSQVHELDVMLRNACDLILKEFNLYYAQVYLTDAGGSTLILEAGTGVVGAQLVEQGHSLPININSINGRAATEKRSVVISDTTQSATFRPNALLPETRGEMAVPLIVAGKVVGALDMQSRNPGVLTEEILPAFEALAGQLAIAIQNANLLEETEQARAQVEAQARHLIRERWAEHLDAIHEPEQFGFVFSHDTVTPLSEADETQPAEGAQAVVAPIALAGEALGSLVVELNDENRREHTNELASVVARQVAQQIENLRLLKNAERYRAEAEEAARRLTREGWQTYAEKTSGSLGYMYNLKEVLPLNGSSLETADTTLSLKVRDEVVGKLAVQGLDSSDAESIELVNAVAERLSAHIEGLRQYDQTQSALAQSEKLFEASRRITQAADLQELVAVAIEAINIPVINRAIMGSTNLDAEGEVESLDVIANWWNGTGHEATAVGTHYSIETVRMMKLFLSATPLFFDDGFTDERVDPVTMQLAQRLNLRAVAILPLHVGSKQLGVLMLEGEEPHNFTEEEKRLFVALGPQIATMLENQRQFEQTQASLAETQTLYRINEAIGGATELDVIYQTVAKLSCEELGFAGSWIAIYDPASETLRGVAGENMPAERITASLSIDEATPATLAAKMRRMVMVNDPEKDERMGGMPPDVLKRVGKALSMPIMAGQELLGVIAVTRNRSMADLGDREERMLQAIATQLAIVMQRINLFDQVRKQAEREAMLNVINQKIQSATSVEAVLQIAARELGHALGAPMTVAQLSMKEKLS